MKKNQVHQDAIWRQMIRQEEECAIQWPEKWAFMGAEREEIKETIIGDPTSVYSVKRKLHLEDIEEYLLCKNYKRLLIRKTPREKTHYPQTQAQCHGWRDKIDKYYKITHPRGNLKWYSGPEAFP